LATRLNPAQRETLHCAMTQWICSQSISNGWNTELWIAGDKQHDFVLTLTTQFDLVVGQQQGGDLGARLAHAFQSALFDYDKVVVIGSDCPFIDRRYLTRAFLALDQSDVVIGPASDGGYVLLGLRQFCPALFDNIPWGTQHVGPLTQSIAAREGLAVSVLPTLNDIDRPEDLILLNNRQLPASLQAFAQVTC